MTTAVRCKPHKAAKAIKVSKTSIKTSKTLTSEVTVWSPAKALGKPSVGKSCWELTESVLSATPRRTLLHGPPGTGKTQAAVYAGLLPGQEVSIVTLTDETPATDLLGRYTLRNHGGGSAEMVWQDGIAIEAWRKGNRLVINELDHGGPDVQSLLHVIFDDVTTARVTLPTGETVRPAEGFQIVATMNGSPSDLPQALRDRFPVCIHISEIHPEALLLLPKELRKLAEKSVLSTGDSQASIRVWFEFAALAEKLDIHQAAHATFGRRAPAILSSIQTSLTRLT